MMSAEGAINVGPTPIAKIFPNLVVLNGAVGWL